MLSGSRPSALGKGPNESPPFGRTKNLKRGETDQMTASPLASSQGNSQGLLCSNPSSASDWSCLLAQCPGVRPPSALQTEPSLGVGGVRLAALSGTLLPTPLAPPAEIMSSLAMLSASGAGEAGLGHSPASMLCSALVSNGPSRSADLRLLVGPKEGLLLVGGCLGLPRTRCYLRDRPFLVVPAPGHAPDPLTHWLFLLDSSQHTHMHTRTHIRTCMHTRACHTHTDIHAHTPAYTHT